MCMYIIYILGSKALNPKPLKLCSRQARGLADPAMAALCADPANIGDLRGGLGFRGSGVRV